MGEEGMQSTSASAKIYDSQTRMKLTKYAA